MSKSAHPSELTLLDYARGGLKRGAGLVMAGHLERCAACRADVAALEAAAGALMSELPPAALQEHALERMLASIERPAPQPVAARAPVSPLLEGVSIPAALSGVDIGPARWLAPGIHIARLRGGDASERAYLLRVGPGQQLPCHGHHGDEMTLVLKGVFIDDTGRHTPGDLIQAGRDDEHKPVVGEDEACVCLIAADGAMVMKEWLPRLLQPLFGV